MVGDGTVLDVESVDPDPFVQFGRWYDEAAAVVTQPEAMALATAGADGRPSVRMVLLKGWGPDGFTFFTNYGSRKGRDLRANPQAALLFHWEALGRQVRVDGPVHPVGADESDAYFASRPFGSQIGAIASRQGEVIESRAALHERAARLSAELAGSPVSRPGWWGGYRLVPLAFELWQQGTDRLHDRVRYLPGATGWERDRLQP
jgi:pyridoxamine 5'-phosphate oxidase